MAPLGGPFHANKVILGRQREGVKGEDNESLIQVPFLCFQFKHGAGKGFMVFCGWVRGEIWLSSCLKEDKVPKLFLLH